MIVKRSRSLFVLASLITLLVPMALAQKGEGPIDPAPPKGHTPDEIIKIVAAKEKEFQAARERYVYRQDINVEELEGNTVAGNWREDSDISFDDKGNRQGTVIFAPQPTLVKVQLQREDHEDIEHFFTFVITPETLPIYDVKYLGQQREDELNTYVFDVTPVHMEKNKRYFKGKIWVDDQDLMVVKSSGIGYPNSKDNVPMPFTTWREQIDGKYWFPTYTRGEMVYPLTEHGHEVDTAHVRATIKYTDYKQYKSSVKITFGDEVPDPNAPASTTPPPPKTETKTNPK